MVMDKAGCWNYRVIKRQERSGDEACYQIYEVYYDREGKIELWSDDPVEPAGESLQELREDCLHYSAALERPVLVEQKKDGREHLVDDDVNSRIDARLASDA